LLSYTLSMQEQPERQTKELRVQARRKRLSEQGRNKVHFTFQQKIIKRTPLELDQ
jgi:hypothetical protein